jgi:hypothetical protein
VMTLLDIIRVETSGFDTKSPYGITVLVTALCFHRRVHYKVTVQTA